MYQSDRELVKDTVLVKHVQGYILAIQYTKHDTIHDTVLLAYRDTLLQYNKLVKNTVNF